MTSFWDKLRPSLVQLVLDQKALLLFVICLDPTLSEQLICLHQLTLGLIKLLLRLLQHALSVTELLRPLAKGSLH